MGCLKRNLAVFSVHIDDKVCTNLRGFGWGADDLCVGPRGSMWTVNAIDGYFFGTGADFNKLNSVDCNADSECGGFAFVQMVDVCVVVGAVSGYNWGDAVNGWYGFTCETVWICLWVGNAACAT